MHRDLKPENLLLINKGDIKNIKIIDFGISCHFSKNSLKQTFGSVIHLIKLLYMAPEVLKSKYN